MLRISWLRNVSAELLSTPERASLPAQSSAITQLCFIYTDKLMPLSLVSSTESTGMGQLHFLHY